MIFTSVTSVYSPGSFHCHTAEKILRKKYAELSNLPYNNMEAGLYGKEVITYKEKMSINSLPDNKKMEYLLDVIILSLKHGICSKFKGFLEAMEENEDILLKNTAAVLGMLSIHCKLSVAIFGEIIIFPVCG